MSGNKDAVLAERRLLARYGQTVGVTFSGAA